MSNIFLQIEGIHGESRDAEHRDWIEISQATWEPSAKDCAVVANWNPGFHVLDMVKQVEKSSPLLALSCASGFIYKAAILEFTRPVGGQVMTYYRIRLTQVLVARIAGAAKPDSVGFFILREEVRLSFAEIIRQLP